MEFLEVIIEIIGNPCIIVLPRGFFSMETSSLVPSSNFMTCFTPSLNFNEQFELFSRVTDVLRDVPITTGLQSN